MAESRIRSTSFCFHGSLRPCLAAAGVETDKRILSAACRDPLSFTSAANDPNTNSGRSACGSNVHRRWRSSWQERGVGRWRSASDGGWIFMFVKIQDVP